MRILGIDPGSLKLGYALIEMNNSYPRHLTLLDSGTLKFDHEKEYLKRLPMIFKACSDLYQSTSPQEIALESLIYVKSPTALIKLAQARGAVIAALTQKGTPTFEYSPNLVKSSVGGHGLLDKKSLQLFLQTHWFKTSTSFPKTMGYDESDAIAVAICHTLWQGQEKLRRPSKIKNSLGHVALALKNKECIR